MTIALPNLDDRTYADLVEEMRSLIPTECPTWTDHNPSDTGIILLELFAWLTEMALYRVNQIPDQNWGAMLSLLGGELPSSEQPLTDHALQNALQATLLNLRQRYRAVTPTDFEQLTLYDWHQSAAAKALGFLGRVQRVQCLPQVNLSALPESQARMLAPGHISVVILPQKLSASDESAKQPSDGLKQGLWNFLDPRRLLTTQVHIVGPEYVEVAIQTTLRLQAGIPKTPEQQQQIKAAITAFFDPWTGGKQQQGWPFGRNVYKSDLYELLDNIAAVDYVEQLELRRASALSPMDDVSTWQAATPTESIEVGPNQLVNISLAALTFKESWEA